jgi:hypothetical protein
MVPAREKALVLLVMEMALVLPAQVGVGMGMGRKWGMVMGIGQGMEMQETQGVVGMKWGMVMGTGQGMEMGIGQGMGMVRQRSGQVAEGMERRPAQQVVAWHCWAQVMVAGKEKAVVMEIEMV